MLRRSDFCQRVWLPAVAAAGLEGAHFHDLRHVAGTLEAQSGASVAEVMARLGHSSPRASLRYVHATSDRDIHVAVRRDHRSVTTRRRRITGRQPRS